MLEIRAILDEIESQKERYISKLRAQHDKMENNNLRTLLGKIEACEDIERKFEAML